VPLPATATDYETGNAMNRSTSPTGKFPVVVIGGINGGFGGSPDAAQACARELTAGRACGAQSYYLLQAIYFNGKLYKSKADCLTAAHAARLPLDLCP